jgi:hypothetical protein
MQWVSGALSLGVKRPGREADFLHLSSAEVKNGGAIATPPIRLYGLMFVQLIKHRDNFTFFFTTMYHVPKIYILYVFLASSLPSCTKPV